MSETETVNPPEQLFQDPKIKILAVCMHGRSRSGAVAKEITKFGYENVRTLGARDYGVSRKEKMDQVGWAEVIIFTSHDAEAEITSSLDKHSSQKIPVRMFLSNHDHYILREGRPQQKRELEKLISERLLDTGFINFTEQQT